MSMIDGLPPYYRKSQVVKDLYDAIQSALEKFEGDMDIKASNLFVLTASDPSLHEKDVGLPNDSSIDTQTGRAKVLARLQGCELLTPVRLKTIIENFGVSVDIVEHIGDYSFSVIFHQPNVSEGIIRETIEELKPAHLAVDYMYRYYGTFEFGSEDYEYDPDKGFDGGYLGNIGSEESLYEIQ